MKQKLIINADDYGMSPRFNTGIIYMINHKIVSSTTVMINEKYIDAQELLKNKSISVGLHINVTEENCEKETEKQIKKFEKIFGTLPSHMDGHKHCHLRPYTLHETIKCAKKYAIPLRSRFVEDRKIIQKNNVATPDHYISWHPIRFAKLYRNLQENDAPITELVSHPGYFDKNCSYPYNREREEEMSILQKPEIQDLIISKYELISYDQL
ncbi:MAG: hypothetical protein CR972_00620 [Candidatus Moraniibacteriota bacterium]|nr:MAG: hypothetical protein CR972_00620 [Candidatus Moranbacteria bacterium]